MAFPQPPDFPTGAKIFRLKPVGGTTKLSIHFESETAGITSAVFGRILISKIQAFLHYFFIPDSHRRLNPFKFGCGLESNPFQKIICWKSVFSEPENRVFCGATVALFGLLSPVIGSCAWDCLTSPDLIAGNLAFQKAHSVISICLIGAPS